MLGGANREDQAGEHEGGCVDVGADHLAPRDVQAVDREQRGGDQPGRGAVKSAAERVGQPHAEGADQRHCDARGDEQHRRVGISGVGESGDVGMPPRCQTDRGDPGVDCGNEIDNGRPGMAEPAGVERAVDQHPQRGDHEDRLVGIVHRRQAEADIMQSPAERDQQDCPERDPGLCAGRNYDVETSSMAVAAP